jgi:hypothetical protein
MKYLPTPVADDRELHESVQHTTPTTTTTDDTTPIPFPESPDHQSIPEPIPEIQRAHTQNSTTVINTLPDGRCFFRSLVIAMNKELQDPRKQTGELLDPMKAIKETAKADNLRANMITQMCNLTVEPGSASLSADMPHGTVYRTLAERILAMSDPNSMVGELEIQSTSTFLQREIHVYVGTQIIKYGSEIGQKLDVPLKVKYTPFDDAGHYESIVSFDLVNTSPRTKTRRKLEYIRPTPSSTTTKLLKRKERATCSEILTSSPYKSTLESCIQRRISKEDSANAPTLKKRIRKRGQLKRKKCDDERAGWYCFYCHDATVEDMIKCQVCLRWAHRACAGVEIGPFNCEFCQ